MKRRVLLALVLLALVAGPVFAHDLFLLLDHFFVSPNATVELIVRNGEFTKSENAIERNRVAHLDVVGPAGKRAQDTTAVSARGKETVLKIQVGSAGTYVVGFATKASEISLDGKKFNEYLREEKITSVLAAREREKALAKPARERYAKHVKAILQVGEARSGQFAAKLGYPVELVPLDNPYDLRPGATLRVQCWVRGQLRAGLDVLAGGLHPDGAAIPEQATVSDQNGVATFKLGASGRWYVKFIDMVPSRTQGIDYESNWTTLTFEVR